MADMIRRLALLAAPLLLLPGHLGPATASLTHAHRPLIAVGANQSNNWSGYNQGTLEKSGTMFHQVSGDWTVPTATQHKAGEAEYSATWVGIGGGCVDANCTLTDSTLIQAGTSQDVDASGTRPNGAAAGLVPAEELNLVDTNGARLATPSAPCYLAQDRGYYAAEGLEVEFSYGTMQNLLSQVSQGEIAFASASGDALMPQRQQGVTVTYVMTFWTRNPIGALGIAGNNTPP